MHVSGLKKPAPIWASSCDVWDNSCAKGAGISDWLSTQQPGLAKGFWTFKGSMSAAGLVASCHCIKITKTIEVHKNIAIYLRYLSLSIYQA